MGNKLIPSSRKVLREWRTWGRRFCQNAMSVWHDSSNDMLHMSRKFCDLSLEKNSLKKYNIFDPAVMTCIVHQTKPNQIFSCAINAKLMVCHSALNPVWDLILYLILFFLFHVSGAHLDCKLIWLNTYLQQSKAKHWDDTETFAAWAVDIQALSMNE